MLQRELCSCKRINTRIDIRERDLHPHMTERKIYLRWQMRLGRCRAIDIVAAANLAGKWATYAARSHGSIQWCVCGPSYPVWWDRPVDCQGALFLLNVSVIQQTVGYGGKRWGWYHRCQQHRRVVQRLLRYPIGGGKRSGRESLALLCARLVADIRWRRMEKIVLASLRDLCKSPKVYVALVNYRIGGSNT